MGKQDVKLIEDGKRIDGRDLNEMRDIKIKSGVVSEADGSAYIQWGDNKILCGVYGPQKCIPQHEASPYRAIVKCRYMMSPFASKGEHGRSGPSRRSRELSKVIKEVFENLILVDKFPNTEINIYTDVLQADGGTRTTSITGAAVALSNAGIPMKDIASSLAIGKGDDEIMVDLNGTEDNNGQADVPIALSHKDKEILLMQMDGLLTKEEIRKMLELAEEKSEKVYGLQKQAIEDYYEKGREKIEW